MCFYVKKILYQASIETKCTILLVYECMQHVIFKLDNIGLPFKFSTWSKWIWVIKLHWGGSHSYCLYKSHLHLEAWAYRLCYFVGRIKNKLINKSALEIRVYFYCSYAISFFLFMRKLIPKSSLMSSAVLLHLE